MNQPAREMSDRPNGHIGLKTSATLGDSWPDRRPQLEAFTCSTSRVWSDR